MLLVAVSAYSKYPLKMAILCQSECKPADEAIVISNMYKTILNIRKYKTDVWNSDNPPMSYIWTS